jgi:hypothetical protein
MTMPAEDGGAMITMVYAEQVKMSAQLAVLTDRIVQLADHESRIRKLEAWRYALPPAAVGGAASFSLSIWARVGHH